MDTYAFLLLGVGIILYFVARKNHPKLKSLSYFVIGCGTGLLAGALWAFAIVQAALP